MKSSVTKFLLFLLLASSANSQELQEKFWDWTLFKTNRGDQIICYLSSTPIKSRGYLDHHHPRGEPFFLVTDIKNDADEISVASGFVFKRTSDVELSFGSKKFYLFPYQVLAWAHDKNADIDIIKEMQKSADMVVTGIATNGKIVSDTYSLIGFSQSYRKLKENCK